MITVRAHLNTLSGRQIGWAVGALRVCQPQLAAPPLALTVWRIALWTTLPLNGTWQITAGGGMGVPVVVTPAANGSDLVDVPGAAPLVEWIATSAAGATDLVAASMAPYVGAVDVAFEGA